MGENVQCPVCTLYLHAGMNLSDHLETHPKEQVIRALVQMTISGGGSSALASVLKGESGDVITDAKKSSLDPQGEKQQLSEKSSDLNISSAASSCSASASNCSLSNQSTGSSSRNSNIISNFSNSHIEDSSASETISTANAKQSQKIEESSVVSKEKKMPKDASINERYSNIHRNYHNANSAIELTNGSNNFSMFASQRYSLQQPQRNGIGDQQHQLNGPSEMPPPPAPGVHHQEISRTVLPPSQQVQAIPSQSNTSGSATFHTLQAQQLPHPPPHHASHLANIGNGHGRHPHVFNGGQHQQTPSQTHHHQQDLKVIYSSGLPPPPPLQVVCAR